MISRRHLLRGMAAGVGASLGPGALNSVASKSALGSENIRRAAAANTGPAKRVIFFLQNQGFHPDTCVTKGLKESVSLDGVTLPEPISGLEEVKDKINIITGLHGRHTSPSHSAYFGALGGYRGGIGVAPSASTIDHVISELLPPAILPHLRVGMDALSNMKSRPTLATLSAAGAGKPLFMHSNPNDLYQMLFGGISSGDVKQKFEAKSRVFDQIERLANSGAKSLPDAERRRYATYTDGFRDLNGLRERLSGVSDHLQKFVPEYDDRFTKPEFETDWHDALLDISIAALQSGITNVLTVGSGRGEIFGAWKGLGITEAGHNLGHVDQPDNPIWIKIRQYNCRMLVKIDAFARSDP